MKRNFTAGRIAFVREHEQHSVGLHPAHCTWTVYYMTCFGLHSIHLHGGDDPDILPPLPNETIQITIVDFMWIEIRVSGRRFSEVVPLEVFRREVPLYFEPSYVNVPADLKR